MDVDSGSAGSDRSTWGIEARAQLEQELSRLRDERRRLAGALRGDDSGGDSGDRADLLERGDDLTRMDRRISEVTESLSEARAKDPSGAGRSGGLPDGTVVTLRSADGTVDTLLVVTLIDEIPEQQRAGVLTTDSPLGQALAGSSVGDTITYQSPEGEAQVDLLAIRPGPP